MSILISAAGLSKSFSARPLFNSITFAIESRERIGLIGPNGAGKSTLLRILAGQADPDDGKLSLQRGLKVGFLEQVPTFSKDTTVEASILEGAHDPDDWEYMAKAQEIMSKLSLNDPQVPVKRLSGGWKKRVALARELMREPDLLLLDEPTNHLDLESIFWLEEFLHEAPFATLVITHDRFFLQKIATRILELDRRNPGGLLSIKGDYVHYLESKELLMAAQERQETTMKNTLRRETEWLRQGAKARTTKQQARIQRAGDLKAEVSELEYRNQSRTVSMDFQTTQRNPKKLIEIKNISKTYGDRNLFTDLSLVVSPGNRIGLLGHNGCGKSTLVRILLGTESPDSGVVTRSENLTVAYFEQNRDSLDPTVTVAKTLAPSGDFVSYRGNMIHVKGYLDRFLFTSGQLNMAVGKLSGGEQSRLFIAKLMLEECNLLVLDEPTNDLDLATLRILEECLIDFPGAIVLVTHDRYFIDQVATQILAFEPEGLNSKTKKITSFTGFAQWETWFQQQSKLVPANISSGGGSSYSPDPEPAAPTKKKKLGFKEQREYDSMESTIQKLEKTLEDLQAESLLPANSSNAKNLAKLTQEMTELQAKIDGLYQRWAELESP